MKNNNNDLFNALPIDEICDDELIYTVGDSLLFQFFNGNWSASVEEMIDKNYSVTNLLDYINDQQANYEVSEYLDWFDKGFFARLGNTNVKFN